MKILMLINGLYPEAVVGVEEIGAELAGLLALKHDVVVYTSYQKHLPQRETRNGFLIKRIKSSGDYPVSIPLGLRTFHFLLELKREKPIPDRGCQGYGELPGSDHRGCRSRRKAIEESGIGFGY